jgi:hypothetical protein
MSEYYNSIKSNHINIEYDNISIEQHYMKNEDINDEDINNEQSARNAFNNLKKNVKKKSIKEQEGQEYKNENITLSKSERENQNEIRERVNMAQEDKNMAILKPSNNRETFESQIPLSEGFTTPITKRRDTILPTYAPPSNVSISSKTPYIYHPLPPPPSPPSLPPVFNSSIKKTRRNPTQMEEAKEMEKYDKKEKTLITSKTKNLKSYQEAVLKLKEENRQKRSESKSRREAKLNQLESDIFKIRDEINLFSPNKAASKYSRLPREEL